MAAEPKRIALTRPRSGGKIGEPAVGRPRGMTSRTESLIVMTPNRVGVSATGVPSDTLIVRPFEYRGRPRRKYRASGRHTSPRRSVPARTNNRRVGEVAHVVIVTCERCPGTLTEVPPGILGSMCRDRRRFQQRWRHKGQRSPPAAAPMSDDACSPGTVASGRVLWSGCGGGRPWRRGSIT
jgi:hypothetical protein